MPDSDDILFGQIAVKAGFVSEAQLHEGLRRQRRDAANNRPRRLGEILIEMGHLTREQAQSVLRRQQTRTGEHKMVASYEVLAKLGEGGMGSVYLARDARTGREVALKVLPPKLAENRDFLLRFHREAKSVLALQHPNIAAGLDVGVEDGYHFFAMEYIDGPTLYDVIRKDGRVSEKRALEVALQVAQALEHAASRGIVHRDIKPENIMFNSAGQAKLVDLGLARSYRDENVRLTQSGMAIGTPHYISPEQARGEHEVDTRSDIYSLGATIYHATTGRVPFDGTTAAVIMTKHLSEELPWPSDVNAEVSEATSIVISRMMAKDAADRYQTPTELIEDIRRAQRGEKPSRQLLPVGRSLISSAKVQAAAKEAERRAREKRKARLDETAEMAAVKTSPQLAAGIAALRAGALGAWASSRAWFKRQPPRVKVAVCAGATVVFLGLLYLIAMPGDSSRRGGQAPALPRVPSEAAGSAEPADAESSAKAALAAARDYERATPSLIEEIRARYNEVIDRHPGTDAAREALGRLIELARAPSPAGAQASGQKTPPETPASPAQPQTPRKETVIDLVGEGLAGWKFYGDWSRAGDAIWFSYDAASPLRRSLVSGSRFGDIVLTGEFRVQGAETLELAMRETASGELRARLSKEDLAGLGDGWHEFSFTAKGAEAGFSVGGRDYRVEREGNPEVGAVRFSLVGGTLGLRNLKARLVNETPPDRILLYSSDFEMGKPAEWIRGTHVTRTTYKGSLGALSGESIGSQNFSSVVILSDLKQGLFRASPDLRVRLAVYVERASFVEARIYVKDVSGHFWWRPKETPAAGAWTVLEFGPADLSYSGAGGMKPAPGDLVTVVSVVAGKPPEQTVLFIDDFEATSKR